jgi:hypothetical protein
MVAIGPNDRMAAALGAADSSWPGRGAIAAPPASAARHGPAKGGPASRRTAADSGASIAADRRDQHGQPGRDRRGEHGGTVVGDPGDGTAVIDRDRDSRQQCRADGRAQLTAGVDDAANQALVAVRDAAAGDDHGGERGPRGPESDRHDGRQQQAVTPGDGQLSEDQEAGHGHPAG